MNHNILENCKGANKGIESEVLNYSLLFPLQTAFLHLGNKHKGQVTNKLSMPSTC